MKQKSKSERLRELYDIDVSDDAGQIYSYNMQIPWYFKYTFSGLIWLWLLRKIYHYEASEEETMVWLQRHFMNLGHYIKLICLFFTLLYIFKYIYINYIKDTKKKKKKKKKN